MGRSGRLLAFAKRKLSSQSDSCRKTLLLCNDSSNCSPLRLDTPSTTLKMLKKYVSSRWRYRRDGTDDLIAASRALLAPMPSSGRSARPASNRPSNPRLQLQSSHNASRAASRMRVRARCTQSSVPLWTVSTYEAMPQCRRANSHSSTIPNRCPTSHPAVRRDREQRPKTSARSRCKLTRSFNR